MNEESRRSRSQARVRHDRNRRILLTLALVVVVACAAVGGTVAWLTATTGELTNTFTVGNINITLTESENLNLKMVPGSTITKDPKVTVKAGSEDCYLFVKVNVTTNLSDFITYALADGWLPLEGEYSEPNVYYREVSAASTDTSFDVLKGNTVTVKDTVTKSMMDAINANSELAPKLIFTAYAVQKANIANASLAWYRVHN
jgi:flagellar basal body-associated protein FliL